MLCSEQFSLEALAKVAYSVIPAKAGMTTSPCFREFCKNLSFHGFLISRGDMNNCS